ncbi:MAG: hypothetical protein LKK41_05650 [Olsenella sp.]|nr:hypothetical protein [Olsenella sp.]MCI2156643.1 hypothetical protein [Olsenella sp.]MCI2187834.1 hypothetical protein [Olsenella sp.]
MGPARVRDADRRERLGGHVAGAGARGRVAPHPEAPPAPLLRLAHLGVAPAARGLGGARRLHDRGIDAGAAVHEGASAAEPVADAALDPAIELLLHHVAEPEERRGVRRVVP